MSQSKPTLDFLLQEYLPGIDDLFAKTASLFTRAPFAATQVIIEHFVVEIEGDTKDSFASEPACPANFSRWTTAYEIIMRTA